MEIDNSKKDKKDTTQRRDISIEIQNIFNGQSLACLLQAS